MFYAVQLDGRIPFTSVSHDRAASRAENTGGTLIAVPPGARLVTRHGNVLLIPATR